MASVPAVPAAPLPVGYGALGYSPPEPGSYALPPLFSAADGEVLNVDGTETRLHRVFGDRIVLLSFIYSTCSDLAGCPLATAVFHRIKQRLDKEPETAKRIRLITVSFDPLHDTPEVMRLYGEGFVDSGVDWHFLTTAAPEQLDPILAAYNQSVQRAYDEQGETLGSYAHVLRVFLVDRERQVRNIYSASFLHPDLLINDVKTLLLERGGLPVRETAAAEAPKPRAPGSGAGDEREGDGQVDYGARSRSMESRRGEMADLISLAQSPPLGLPPVPMPRDNPITPEKAALGRKLFFDRRLSLNNTFSCAMCHIPEQGFTSNEMATAVGIEGRTVRRNAPTVYNSAYLTRLFHDGREYSLEQQVWGPLLARNEMANPSVGSIIEKLRSLPDYRSLFETAFGGRGPSMETVGMALAGYQRTLLSGASAFDRWYYGGERDALSASARRGFGLFAGKGGCVSCHLVGEEAALFTDNRLHNTGIGYRESMQIQPEGEEVRIAPGVVIQVSRSVVSSVSERPPGDLGLYEVTQDPDDRWKYRTPSLRNVALTAPYMHNGSLGTLREVVEFYNGGGVPNALLDPRIRPLGLSAQEIEDLVAFLESLTGDNVEVLVADAFAAPIGDPTESAGTMEDR
ncbi:MAG: cytochrome c peroxidase [Pseudomonadota bacterium]|nr:cytochrome c peroxidase [Pseudomonadota bacterium]